MADAGYERILVKMDEDICNITGIAAHSPTLLVVADNTNNSLKVIDTSAHRMKAYVILEHSPKSVVSMGENEVAVTFPNETYIQTFYIQVDDEKTLIGNKVKNRIEVGRHCCGIDYNRELKLFVLSFEDENAGVQLIKENGTLTHTIGNVVGEDQRFNRPLFVRFGLLNGENVVYVSDHYLGTISCFKIEQVELIEVFRKTFPILEVPRDIAVCSNGNLLICGQTSHNICRVSSTGEDCNVVISGNLESPRALTYMEKDGEIEGRLFVAEHHLDENLEEVCNFLKIFNI